ncbi:MAG: hypothetical protein ABW189_06180 [Rickettsiales bacterium]
MKPVYIVVVLAVIAAVAFAAIKINHKPTAGERLDNAVHDVSEGLENAGEELQNRNAVEKAGDAIEDAGENMRKNN